MAAKREGEIECKGAAMSETTNYDTRQSSNGTESQRLREHADYIIITGAHNGSNCDASRAATEGVCVAEVHVSADRGCEDGANGLVEVVRHADVLVLEQKPKVVLALEPKSSASEPGAKCDE